ncbi:hypothetical protein KDA_38730 [Dictyobacter alpinus]|uniref:Spheroidene monooxygenase n=1 Tax=Dictyobacter alpinus TaxID=2014873 RepID=A0A402BAN0_9CHLR|nr:spheroidene monooxygenase [Dictyobacter alpinus]GCE28389.1 hypothetical protein KDA_38730 [Dictyobacter alpinus]
MIIDDQQPVVAFTLSRYPRRYSGSHVLAHLGLDRWPLMHTEGLTFWRLLGVGQGRVFDPHADLQRSALFTVWRSLADLKRFEAHSKLMQRIHQRSEESWTVHMLPVTWHGEWGSRDPLRAFTPAPAPQEGPWIILTRATIYSSKIRAFLGAVPAVAEELLQQPTLINSVGVGEAPLLYQATLSLWTSLPAIKTFAYGPTTPHNHVIRRTRQEHWYREELFARFRPLASYGTWDGINPLPSFAP